MPYKKGSDLKATTMEMTETVGDARIYVNGVPIEEDWNHFKTFSAAEKKLLSDRAVVVNGAHYTIVVIVTKRKVYHYA